MGRWTQYDEDEYRLPEGMKRVGYDADTQTYTFKDQNGAYWEGPEGAEYGELRKVSEGRGGSNSMDIEASAPTRADGYIPVPASGEGQPLRNGNRDAWRRLFPFFLMISVFLLFGFRLSHSYIKPRPISCPEHNKPMVIKSGDTCWEIAKTYGTSLENLRSINPDVNCAALKPGQRMCVPMDD